VDLGLQEIITYRLTAPEREARRLLPESPPDDKPYLRLANPIVSDRVVMRHSLLASVLEIVERNARLRERIAVFEIGPVYHLSEEGPLPEEQLQLVIAMTGPRVVPSWSGADTSPVDFYDLKGLTDTLLKSLHLGKASYQSSAHPSFHPGKCARILLDDKQVGVLGQTHPLLGERYDLPETPLIAAVVDLEAIIQLIPEQYEIRSIPTFPPVLEDLAVVVSETTPAEVVESVIRNAGKALITDLRLFDLYRGDQVGEGKKSLAYSVVYQASDRTLTDKEVGKVRARIIKALEQQLGAKLRD
jgi:phenylalanyl-tRNA synthetase beta chain